MRLRPKQLNLTDDLNFTGGNIHMGSGKIFLPTGTEANPAVSFEEDDSSGFLLTQPGEVAISAGGTVGFYLNSSGAIELPGTSGIAIQAGTTAERPVAPLEGILRYNLDLSRQETFVDGVWQSLGFVSDLDAYLKVDGTRAMTGALNMGSQNITNSGTINGVSVTAHAARHLPGGTDALATAAAVGLSLATTNTEGTAASFARSDHTHVITGVQPVSTQLTNFAALNSNGLIVRTGSNTFSVRAINGTTNQIVVTNGDAISGAPTVALASNPIIPGTSGILPPTGTTAQRTNTNGLIRYNSDLARLEFYQNAAWGTFISNQEVAAGYQPLNAHLTSLSATATNGMIARTASGTTTPRTLTGTAGRLVVNNGDGVSGNPTFDLATVGTAGQYTRTTVDAYGRVTGGTLGAATYYATRFDSPMTTGSWPVKAQAAAYLDPAHPSMTIRGFDDTTPEGVGITADVPAGAVSCNITLVGRARTSPGSAQAALWNAYFHSYPVGSLAPDWGSAIALNPINVASGNIFLYSVTTNVTVAAMGLTAGAPYQMEITRNANAGGDTLVGDFLLFYVRLDWQAT